MAAVLPGNKCVVSSSASLRSSTWTNTFDDNVNRIESFRGWEAVICCAHYLLPAEAIDARLICGPVMITQDTHIRTKLDEIVFCTTTLMVPLWEYIFDVVGCF